MISSRIVSSASIVISSRERLNTFLVSLNCPLTSSFERLLLFTNLLGSSKKK
nr:MAG TPA: hypothetical protein [Caudoviricetes sp.]